MKKIIYALGLMIVIMLLTACQKDDSDTPLYPVTAESPVDISIPVYIATEPNAVFHTGAGMYGITCTNCNLSVSSSYYCMLRGNNGKDEKIYPEVKVAHGDINENVTNKLYRQAGGLWLITNGHEPYTNLDSGRQIYDDCIAQARVEIGPLNIGEKVVQLQNLN